MSKHKTKAPQSPKSGVNDEFVELDSVPLANVFWVLAFGVGAFVLEDRVVKPELLFQSLAPMFYLGTSFIHEALAKPGGSLSYVAKLVEQYLALGSVGSIIITLLLALSWRLCRLLSPAVKASRGSALRIALETLTPCLLLVLTAFYGYPWMETALQTVMVLSVVLAFRRLPTSNMAAWALSFALANGALTHLAGFAAGGLFTLMVVVPDVIHQSSRKRGIVALFAGIGIAALWAAFFLVSKNSLWPAGTIPRYVTLALYVGLVARAILPLQSNPATCNRPAPKDHAPALSTAIRWCLLALSFTIVCLAVNKTARARLAVAFYSENQQWDQVIDAAKELKTPDWSVRLAVTRALHHQGRLLTEYLDLPHIGKEGVVPADFGGSMEAPAEFAQTLLELGQVNLAEHWAIEAFEMSGERPRVLKILAQINVVKGRPKAALPFLHLLCRNPLHRAWANDFLEHLNRDPKMESDPELAQIRSVKVTTDFPTIIPPNTTFLRQLLHTNPKNRMAFEYLMIEYMLTGKSQAIVQNLNEFETGHHLPRLIEEAVVDYELEATNAVHVALPDDLTETRQRLSDFRKAISSYRTNLETGRIPIARSFGNTYWYYSVYQSTGSVAMNTRR